MLGSGSDYTVFLDHFGISSLDFSFGKKTTYGQYHSIYDSFDWMETFGGTDGESGSSFDLMAFGAKIWGLLALRLADANVLPIDHVIQAAALYNYTSAIQGQGLELSSLKGAVHHYQQAADALQSACTGDSPSVDEKTCNGKLGLAERQFLIEDGLPGRPWFKHILQAPGMDLGYAAEAFPGIQQALDDGDLGTAGATSSGCCRAGSSRSGVPKRQSKWCADGD
jgi:N-acetylated-alpha-linked acidic dipeptidase